MLNNQVFVRWVSTSKEVSDVLQTFVNRGHDLKDYFLNITMTTSSGGVRTFAVFYDRRFDEDKPNVV